MLNAIIIGCGDIGIRVGLRLQQQRYQVTAVVRSIESATNLESFAFNTVILDLDQSSATLPSIPSGGLIFYFAPPTEDGEQDLRMKSFLGALKSKSANPVRIVYISTTAVYADSKGAWINEQAAIQPSNLRGKRRLDAEQQLIEFQRQHPVNISILRVSGIYSANRLPFRQIKARQAILQLEIAPYSNRIHADDLAKVCIAAALNTHKPTATFNVSDGNPGSISQYFKEVALTFNLQPPPEISWEDAQKTLSPGMLSYLRESKRIDNRLMKHELGVAISYPTLTLGLKQCAAELKQKQPNTAYRTKINRK
ncbi:MAG: sugar nucleotide-binding protein [Thiotrichaceae bacterium]|nr:sugar nucleotide-binding protein [Thiotrichaceae bacterium]PCI12817.1 MAG: NAD(P)-dependent oxidoreductase [Thiotrichales bacterium]